MFSIIFLYKVVTDRVLQISGRKSGQAMAGPAGPPTTALNVYDVQKTWRT